jgi:hypothetical protein
MQQSVELSWYACAVLAKHARIVNLWSRVASGALGEDSKSLLLDIGDDGLRLQARATRSYMMSKHHG